MRFRLTLAGVVALLTIALAASAADAPRLNVLLITADDMNYTTPAAFGGKIAADVTPNIDKLASEGIRFDRAHVTVAVCQPSRECLMTGRYPHRNGATGFYPVRQDVPTLEEVLKAAGYQLGILGKVTHLAPAEKFPWDFKHDANELGNGRDPARYYAYVKEFLQKSKDANRPFFLMANSHDPHRPFAGSEQERNRAVNGKGKGKGKKKGGKVAAKAEGDDGEAFTPAKYPAPGRTYSPGEITVPGFLPDLPDVRTEVAQYASSAHRCDETVGQILRALDESGMAQNTLVMFLSDNGMSFPFAKSNCYLTSTRTPWIVRWPDKIKPGGADEKHFISGIDFMPTVLEATGVRPPEGMDGKSFLPLLTGGEQGGRDHVFTCYNDNSGARHYTMRCLQDGQYGYIYNAWADGKYTYRVEPMAGLTFNAMEKAAPNDPAIAARVEMLLHRVPEELYDFQADPDALHNLAGDSKFQDQVKKMRAEVLKWMESTGDPLAEKYRAVAAK